MDAIARSRLESGTQVGVGIDPRLILELVVDLHHSGQGGREPDVRARTIDVAVGVTLGGSWL